MSSGKTMTDGGRGDRPCEVTLVGGFLGAGKTTFLRNVLTWPGDLSSTAVLVNEFGKIGIDGELLQGAGTPVIELTNGCICCTLQGDLLRTLKEVLDRFGPRRLLIEATGVANPFDILATLRLPQLLGRLALHKVVTVLDADFWKAREILGPLFYNQIRAADLVLLNKVDLLAPEDVPQCLAEIQETHPSCAVVPTHHCQIDPQVLWRATTFRDQEPDLLFTHHHEAHGDADELGFVNFAFEAEAPFREACFRQLMAAWPLRLYRAKGYVLLGDSRFFMNHVGGRSEWVALGKGGPTKLAFVGWRVDPEEILDGLRACLVPCDGD